MICQGTLASNEDLKNAGLVQEMSDYCASYFGYVPTAVEVNADGNKFQMCLTANATRWDDAVPETHNKVIVTDKFTKQRGTR